MAASNSGPNILHNHIVTSYQPSQPISLIEQIAAESYIQATFTPLAEENFCV